RRRVLTFSILLYAGAAFIAGFSTSLNMLLVCRCCVFVGVCVEFVAAVAWLAELFDDPHQREKVLGLTQAFSSIGGLMIALANGLAVTWALQLPAVQMPGFLQGALGQVTDSHAAWRYTLMSGLIPALPLLIIRPFLPESPKWAQKKASGTLRRPSIAELFSPELKRTTVITTIMFACSFGAAFGAIQHMPQMVPGLPEVKAKVEAEIQAKAADKPKPEQMKVQKLTEQGVAASVTKVQEVGGLVGRILLAFLVIRIASRRRVIQMFLLPGLLIIPFTFGYAAMNSLNLTYLGMFFAGMLTVGQFSFWGNYLPGVYPMHLRGTGESFAANIGGRLIGTSFAWVTSSLAVKEFIPGSTPTEKWAYAACGVGLFVYVVNLGLSFLLPEPTPEVEEGANSPA
ncbi:MAG: MFS transporter, partial [Planctomycetaceae bacterium]|nr:MFS transporter [Planctomycetaceae bacterium]